MPLVVCLCGARVEAGDTEALVEAYLAHAGSAHPDIKASERRRAEVVDAIRRTGGWDGQRVQLAEPVEILPLRPGLKDDYLAFFDGDAFADNPVWATCYCLSYHLATAPDEFMERTGGQNRADKGALIDRGEASGVLAYAGGRVVGWCNASPRTAFGLLDRTPEFASDDPASTGAIVCYVIAPQYRGRGLARRLLDGACDMLRERGLRWVDAYPPRSQRGEAGSYHGRMSMYVAAGFEHVRDAGPYAVMRKAL
jgi:ribosomal protein S18 acetylase RimI-like enzyme